MRQPGRQAGVYQLANRSDVAVGFHIGDRLAAGLKEIACKSIPRHLAHEAHKPGSYSLHRMPGGVTRRRLMLRAKGAEAPAAADRTA
ncbi:hypothetical protein GCM10020295_78290 [Streptomyces cinereospinus]